MVGCSRSPALLHLLHFLFLLGLGIFVAASQFIQHRDRLLSCAKSRQAQRSLPGGRQEGGRMQRTAVLKSNPASNGQEGQRQWISPFPGTALGSSVQPLA